MFKLITGEKYTFELKLMDQVYAWQRSLTYQGKTRARNGLYIFCEPSDPDHTTTLVGNLERDTRNLQADTVTAAIADKRATIAMLDDTMARLTAAGFESSVAGDMMNIRAKRLAEIVALETGGQALPLYYKIYIKPGRKEKAIFVRTLTSRKVAQSTVLTLAREQVAEVKAKLGDPSDTRTDKNYLGWELNWRQPVRLRITVRAYEFWV